MIHLQVHSNHSLLRGTATPRQLLAKAVEHGMCALALTDTDGLYGAIPFYEAARAAGVKPILGARLGPCVVLAKDREGYAQLCELVTAWHLGAEAAPSMGSILSILSIKARAPLDDMDSMDAGGPPETGSAGASPFRGKETGSAGASPSRGHLVLLSADRGVLAALEAAGWAPVAAVTHYGDGRSRYQAGALAAWAQQRGLRAAAVNPVYFLAPEEFRIHRVLSAIRENATIDTVAPEALAHPQDYFRTPREMERLYAQWPELLRTAEAIAEECDLELELGRPLFPDFPLQAGETPFSWLWKQSFAGLKARYQPLTPAIIDRVRYELDIINTLGFAPYFLIVWDIVQFARARQIPIMGRGSAANSVVAYALGITRVDPFRYKLYFERFLNLERTDCPDIDLDICWRRRDEVIDYVYTRYGAEQVAMICTLNTFRARAAVREVAKAHGLSDREIGRVTKLLPHYGAGDVRTMVKHIPECRGINLDEEPLRSIVEIGARIDGFPRHLSIHPCGLVIAPERLTHFVPLQRAAKGILVTQYDMEPVERLGLIKMDLLGHRSLTVIDDTVKAIQENRGVALDIEAVLKHRPLDPPSEGDLEQESDPLVPSVPFVLLRDQKDERDRRDMGEPDPLTAQLLREGLTIGCFQIESPAMRGLLRKTHAASLETLIQTIALVRPGASGSGMKKHFIDRHHGREATEYLHPALEEVLSETYGIMVYQEDVLKVAHAIAGMDLTEADALRRAMGKHRSPREMAKSMKRFLDKARANGVEDSTAEAIWELIANFAAYSYCKAHAATYGEIAYQCAYLKAHYPAEFFAAVLSNRGGFYSPPVYLEEAKRRGLEVRPPDVRRSQHGYTAEDDALRIGFVEVRNLNLASVEAILRTRAEEPFLHLQDFIERTAIPYADAGLLLDAGALDCFGLPRPVQHWQLRLLCENRQEPSKISRQNSLIANRNHPIPPISDSSGKSKADAQWQALGLMAHRHPLEYFLPRLLAETIITSTDLPRYVGDRATLVGWLVAERRQVIQDGRGVMKFLTLEDTHGTFEAVLFSEAYQAYGHLLTTLGPYLLTGEVQMDSDALALIVEEVAVVAGHALSQATAGKP